jgi:hypothetical protein
MSYKINSIKKLGKVIFNSILPNPTFGDINITDDEVKLNTDGIVKFITINFRGLINVYNKLPDGYGISITKNKIFIYNLLGRTLKDDGLLFTFIGDLEIRSVEVRTFSDNLFLCSITDNNRTLLINHSKTNLEDDSLLLLEEEEIEPIRYSLSSNKIDDNSIKGLHTKKPFANGYSGSFNYHPDENVYMTGKQLTNESQPVLNPKLPIKSKTIQKKVKRLSNKYNAILRQKDLQEVQVTKRVEKIQPAMKKQEPVSVAKTKVVKKEGKY